MKKIFKSLVVSSVFVGLLGNVVAANAASNDDATLKGMGYSKAEISQMSDHVKSNLISHGGHKSELKIESIKQYYNSTNGEKYEITDSNRDQIEKIMKNDIANYNLSHGLSIMNNSGETLATVSSPQLMAASSAPTSDEAFASGLTVQGYVDKSSDYNSTNYGYYADAEFTWTKQPVFRLADKIAMAWDEDYKGIANTFQAWYSCQMANGSWSSPNYVVLDQNQDRYGIDANIRLQSLSVQMGGISQTIVSPKTNKGHVGKFQVTYVHTLLPISGSLSFGPASVDVPASWSSQEFVVDFNNIVGQ